MGQVRCISLLLLPSCESRENRKQSPTPNDVLSESTVPPPLTNPPPNRPSKVPCQKKVTKIHIDHNVAPIGIESIISYTISDTVRFRYRKLIIRPQPLTTGLNHPTPPGLTSAGRKPPTHQPRKPSFQISPFSSSAVPTTVAFLCHTQRAPTPSPVGALITTDCK